MLIALYLKTKVHKSSDDRIAHSFPFEIGLLQFIKS